MLYGSRGKDDYGSAEDPAPALAPGAMNMPLALQRLFTVRKPGEKDRSLGMRLALSVPVASYPLLFAGMLLARVGGESGLGITLFFWLFIGAWEWLYLAPAIGWALVKKHPEMAKGLALGGVIIAITNGAAWAMGMYLGVRQWAQ